MIYSFGCSFTYGECDKGQISTHFTALLAEHYGVDYVNAGISGGTLEDTLVMLSNYMLDFKEGDIVVIGLTNPTRIQAPIHVEYHRDMYFLNKPRDKNHKLFKSVRGLGGMPISQVETIIDLVIHEQETGELPAETGLGEFLQRHLVDRAYWEGMLSEYTEEHWKKIYYNIALKLMSRGIRVVMWHWRWWHVIGNLGKQYKCDCGHWSPLGHRVMFDKIVAFLKENNDLEECELHLEML